MPIKRPNSPDYHCAACGRLFRQSFWRRLLGLRPPPLIRCPKCGTVITTLLQY